MKCLKFLRISCKHNENISHRQKKRSLLEIFLAQKSIKFNNIRTLFRNEACADGNLNKNSSNVGITDRDITVHKRTFQGVKWSVTVKNQDLLLTFTIMTALIVTPVSKKGWTHMQNGRVRPIAYRSKIKVENYANFNRCTTATIIKYKLFL